MSNKPAIPMRNLVIFMIASFSIYLAWNWYENRNKPKALTAQQQRDVRDGVAQLAGLAPAGNGVGDLWIHAGRELARQVPPETRAAALAAAEEEKRRAEAAKPKPPPVPAFKAV